MTTKKAKKAPAFTGLPLIERLATKHSGDLFVPECKDGGTQQRHHIRLDAWAMARSWAHPCTYGYEIKMSRSDFMRDEKWPAYLALCNRFSFVAPKGLISQEELPPEVGLIEAIGAKRLITRRKAAHREGDLDLSLARYLLMCRVVVKDYEVEDKLGYWQAWLDDQAKRKDMGYHVARVTQEKYTRDVVAVQVKNDRLEAEVAQLAEVKRYLEGLGIKVRGDQYSWRTRTVDELRHKLGQELLTQMQGAIESLDKWLAGEAEGESS